MTVNTNQNEFILKKILEDYQIPNICFFEDYLSEIFIDLAEKSQRDLKTVEKYIFSKYFGIYGIILDRLFKILDHDNDGVLDRVEFIIGMKILYSQGTSFKSLSKFIFKLYDFDQDGKISKDDVKLILSHIFLSYKEFKEIFKNMNQFQNDLKKIIDFSFQEKNEMDFNDFCYVIENICSDIFIFVLIFLLKKRPFSDETISVYKSGKNISPNILRIKYSKLDTTIVKSPILNNELISNPYNKKNHNKLLLETDNKFFDLNSIDNKIKGNIIFHEGLIFKLSKNKVN